MCINREFYAQIDEIPFQLSSIINFVVCFIGPQFLPNPDQILDSVFKQEERFLLRRGDSQRGLHFFLLLCLDLDSQLVSGCVMRTCVIKI